MKIHFSRHVTDLYYFRLCRDILRLLPPQTPQDWSMTAPLVHTGGAGGWEWVVQGQEEGEEQGWDKAVRQFYNFRQIKLG